MKLTKLFTLLATVLCISLAALPGVYSHGYIAVPAARNAKFRCGFPDAAPNYDLAGLSAGGPATVRGQGLGHGACGDDIRGDQPHLEGGPYTADQHITGKYRPNEVFETKIQVTVYHSGWFEFYLCPIGKTGPNWDMKTTQECLDQYPLQRADGRGIRYWINSGGTGLYTVRLRMPDVECERCVFQWYWQTANSGCGRNTEEFWNCADISVKSSFTDDEIGPTATPSSGCMSGTEWSTRDDNGCAGYNKCPREYDPSYTLGPCVGPADNPDPFPTDDDSEQEPPETSSSSSSPQSSSSSSSSSSSEPESSSSSEHQESSSDESSSSPESSHPQESSDNSEPSSSSSSEEPAASSSSENSAADDDTEPSCNGKAEGNYCYGRCSLNYYTCASGAIFENRPVPPGTACLGGQIVLAASCLDS